MNIKEEKNLEIFYHLFNKKLTGDSINSEVINKLKLTIMYNNRQEFWTQEQTNYILKLRNKGKTYSEILVLYNDKFNSRTLNAIKRQVEKLNKKHYTVEIDTIIVKNVRIYPGNLQYSFEVSYKEIISKYPDIPINNYHSISGRYYAYIKFNYNVIVTGSQQGFLLNIKNTVRKGNKPPAQKLSPVMYLMKEILNLSDKDRKQLTLFLNNSN